MLNFHQDITLEIARYLSLADIFSLISVCRKFRHEVAAIRSLWIDALKRTQLRRSLACPVGLDLFTTATPTLLKVAEHTSRLELNWTRQRPSIQSIKVKSLTLSDSEKRSRILTTIRGTAIVVICVDSGNIHSSFPTQLVCFDFDSSKKSDIYEVGDIAFSTHNDEPGNHYIVTVEYIPLNIEELQVRVLNVTYGQGQKASFQEVALYPLKGFAVEDATMYRNSVVIILINENTTELYLTFIDISTGKKTMVTCVSPPNLICDSISFATFSDEPYNITLRDRYQVYRLVCDDSVSGSGDIHARLEAVYKSPELWAEEDVLVQGSAVNWSTGRMWVAHFPEDIVSHASTTMHYWPIGAEAENTKVSLVLRGRMGQYYLDSSFMPQVDMTEFSRYIVAFLNDNETGNPEHVLHLVHLEDDPPAISSRVLDLPRFILFDEICSIGLDDHSGIVYLVYHDGRVFALSYT